MTMNRALIAMLLAMLLCLPLSFALAEEIVLGEPDGEIGLEAVAVDDDGLLGLEEIAGDIDMESDLEIEPIELNADLSLDGAGLPEAVEAPAAANAGDAEDVPLDEAHFPDANFRKKIADWDNNPKDGVLSAEERAAITELYIDEPDNIADLWGIEYFSWIERLVCVPKQTHLDVSCLTSLEYLKCGGKLTSLDVSGCIALTVLDCSHSHLTSLDVSGLTSLQKLYCSECDELTKLDASGCTALEELLLDSEDLHLINLDVSGCSSLKELGCSSPYLTSLDIRGTSLEYLNICCEQLTSLDVSGCIALKELWCEAAPTSLDVSGLTSLETLVCIGEDLISVNFSGCTALKRLWYWSPHLTSLDVSSLTSLEDLKCNGCSKLTRLDVSGCTKLKGLSCKDTQLTSLDISGCTALAYLFCENAQLTSLDISGCNALKEINCASNQLTSFDISRCPNLGVCDCQDNKLKSLNARGCPKLYDLSCENNSLTSLNCSGSSKLRYLTCTNNSLTSLNLSGCVELTDLVCDNNQLKEMELQDLKKLECLIVENNEIEILDLTNNPLLVKTIKKGERDSRGWFYFPLHKEFGYCIYIDKSTRLIADGKTLYTPPSIGKCVVTDAEGETSTKLYKGDTLQLKGTIEKLDPETYTVIWSSSDEKVATVSDTGLVKAVGVGKCTITGKPINGEKGSFKVTVRKAPTSITLSQSKATLYIGDTLALKATLSPKGAKAVFTWKSSNEKVATVNAKGVVKAVGVGKAYISVRTGNGVKAGLVVNVRKAPKSVKLSQSRATLNAGKTLRLKATVTPTDAKTGFTWRSSNKKVATVNEKGVVTAIAKGTAVITVQTENGLKASCKVTVK